jgi:glycosyltransferase involved in cell wall biosynthesis
MATSENEGPGQSPLVSVIMPCLNEARSLGGCIDQAHKALSAAGIEGEVVIADNGSTDGSLEIAEEHRARVVHVSARGYGSAVRGGIEATTAPFIVLGDADGQHNFNEIPDFVEKLRDGYDLVMGNRFSGAMARGAMSWSHRYIGNPLLSGLLRVLFHPRIHDAQCGFRALTRTAYEHMDLRTTGFELCPEMVVKASRQRLRITEIPIQVLPDQRDRPPHLRTVPDGWRHLSFLLMCAPNWLFIAPGAALLGVGVALVSWLFVGPQKLGGVALNTRSELFGVILASLGLQIMSIGLFARVYSYSEPRSINAIHQRSIARVLRTIKLEQGLAVGGGMIVIGLVGAIWQYARWASHGFGIIQGNRAIIFWSLWVLLGVQICFSSFFLSMLGVSRGTWIGDRS